MHTKSTLLGSCTPRYFVLNTLNPRQVCLSFSEERQNVRSNKWCFTSVILKFYDFEILCNLFGSYVAPTII